MSMKDLPRWLLPVLVFFFLAAISAILFVSRLGGSATFAESPSSTGAIQPAEITPSRQNPTQPRDPCSLLMPEEIESELGIQIGVPRSDAVDNPIGEMVCTFPGVNDDDLHVARLVVVFSEGLAPFLVENDYSLDHLFAGRNVSDRFTRLVPDIGDEAFWGGSGAELWNGLHVLIRDVYLQINVNSGDNGNDLNAAQNLALIALNRLFNE